MSGIVGSLFNHRGSGVVAKLGSDGHSFNSGGAGVKAVTEAAAAGGAWSYLSGVNVTEVTNNDFTGLDSTYEVYMFQFGGVMAVNFAPELRWRFGTGSSPTYATTKHSFVYDRTMSGSATYIQAHAENGQYGVFCGKAGPGTAATEPVDGPYGYYGHMYLMGHADSAQHARVHYTGSGFTVDDNDNTIIAERIVTADGVGYYGLTTNVTAMRFFSSNQDWSGENSTTIKLYGLAPS